MLLNRNLFLCLHLETNSVCLLNNFLVSNLAIIFFFLLTRSHIFLPHIYTGNYTWIHTLWCFLYTYRYIQTTQSLTFLQCHINIYISFIWFLWKYIVWRNYSIKILITDLIWNVITTQSSQSCNQTKNAEKNWKSRMHVTS